jgi:hypothetical protein
MEMMILSLNAPAVQAIPDPQKKRPEANVAPGRWRTTELVARPAGFEPTTPWFVVR